MWTLAIIAWLVFETPGLATSVVSQGRSLESRDMVLSRDELTGEVAFKPVLYTITTHPDTLYLVSFEPGDGAEETLVTTGEHPFYVAGREAFVPAAELAVGEALVLARSPGFTAHVTDIRVERGPPTAGSDRYGWDGETYTTYNLEVADWHTYFVGEAGVWVHNQAVGRAACERIAALYHRLRHKEGRTPWDAFTRLMELSDPTVAGQAGRAALIDPHLRYAVREMTLDMFDTANGGQIKSVKQIGDELELLGLRGRLTAAEIDNNHSVPKYVQKRIDDYPLHLFEELKDTCPGMLLHKQDHRISNPRWPNSFHTILNRHIPVNQSRFDDMFPDGLTRSEAKIRLGRAYEEWIDANNLIDPGVDHAVHIKAAINNWIDSIP